MLERQEIDALLISSLYGELTPSEETRLATHLESHPTDKTALAALTSTREAVRESRILAVQLDPPQSISAILLQEAARRAPKPAGERDGWFARLARSFMMHPAMAAAAMLVVVIGVATLVNNRKGDQFSESTAPSVSNNASPTGGAVATDQTIVAEPPAAHAGEGVKNEDSNSNRFAGSGSAAAVAAPAQGSDAYKVDLAEPSDRKQIAEEKVRREIGKAQAQKRDALDSLDDGDDGVSKNKGKDDAPAKKTATAAKTPSGPYMELRTPDPAVKDLEGGYNYESDLAKERQTNAITPGPSTPGTGVAQNRTAPAKTASKDAAPSRQQPDAPKGNAAAVRGEIRSVDTPSTTPRAATQPAPPRNAPAQPTPTAPPPPPPATKPGVSAGSGGGGSVVRDDRQKAPAEDKSANDPQLAWAREQHTAILAQVRSGNCKGAANIAVNLANRDRAYYEQNVATDRSVKECLAYIDNAREKDAEQRAERNRSTEKRANEPAKAADSVK